MLIELCALLFTFICGADQSTVCFVYFSALIRFFQHIPNLFSKNDLCVAKCHNDSLCLTTCALTATCQALLNNGYDLCDNGYSICLLTNKDEANCLITRSLCYQKWDIAQEKCLRGQTDRLAQTPSKKPIRTSIFQENGKKTFKDVLNLSISVCIFNK